MKKIYIQPSMFVGSMNVSEMIAGGASWKVDTGDWDNKPGSYLPTKPGEGEGNDAAAKYHGFYSSYDDAGW